MKLTAYLVAIMTSIMIMIANYSFAQERVLQGKVSSSNGDGLHGVTIQEKGARNFTSSDADGNYKIRLSNPNATLIFSFVGYATRELSVGTEGNLDVTLAPTNTQLNEVIVTALGIRKEVKRIGYATQEIKGSELTKAREPNAVNT